MAAEFVHTSSRLTRDQERDGVPDPQLHSHVVVLAAQRDDGRFAAVDSRELFRSQRVNGAWYRAELAHELRGLGLEVERRTGREGRFFEVAGIPDQLVRRWSRRTEVIERAAREFRDRYGRAPRAGELGAMSVATRGTKTVTAEVDVSAAWRRSARSTASSADSAEALFESPVSTSRSRDVRGELLTDVSRERSMVQTRELEARALEIGRRRAGPRDAREQLDGARSSPVSWLSSRVAGGRRASCASSSSARSPPCSSAPASGRRRVGGARARGSSKQPASDSGTSLSDEQQHALETITGPGGVIVLVGEAGTGKGVVLGAAREAWERDGHRVIGTAVAGAAAQRLGS